MKNPMRMTAATNVVLPVLQRVLAGAPLPVHTDPDWEEFQNAVARITRSEDFQWLGKAVAGHFGEHVLKNLAAQREAAAPAAARGKEAP